MNLQTVSSLSIATNMNVSYIRFPQLTNCKGALYVATIGPVAEISFTDPVLSSYTLTVTGLVTITTPTSYGGGNLSSVVFGRVSEFGSLSILPVYSPIDSVFINGSLFTSGSIYLQTHYSINSTIGSLQIINMKTAFSGLQLQVRSNPHVFLT
jgi:hypothetical protein